MDRKEYQKRYKEEYKKRKKQICLNFTNNEYKEFEKVSKESGITVNKIIVEMVEKQLTKLEQNKDKIDSLKERLSVLNYSVRIIADKVNKLAHQCNVTEGKNFNENDLLLEIKKLSGIIKEFTEQ